MAARGRGRVHIVVGPVARRAFLNPDRAMDSRLTLRIHVRRPPAGVELRVQSGKTGAADLLPPAHATEDGPAFDLEVAVRDQPGGAVDLAGPVVQGGPGARFVYVCSGTLAGHAESGWQRRAKVPLGGIDGALVERMRATPSAVLQARIEGTARDGGPACASVPLLDGGWEVVPAV
jgi:hypothetical protein